MDLRSNKVFDFVVATRNLSEYEKKTKLLQLRWYREWRWLCDKYRNLERQLDELCAEKLSQERSKSEDQKDDDERSCLPFPETTNENYGWLHKKPEFALEKYGSFTIKYPDPTDEITVIKGDIPTLAGGKGFY